MSSPGGIQVAATSENVVTISNEFVPQSGASNVGFVGATVSSGHDSRLINAAAPPFLNGQDSLFNAFSSTPSTLGNVIEPEKLKSNNNVSSNDRLPLYMRNRSTPSSMMGGFGDPLSLDAQPFQLPPRPSLQPPVITSGDLNAHMYSWQGSGQRPPPMMMGVQLSPGGSGSNNPPGLPPHLAQQFANLSIAAGGGGGGVPGEMCSPGRLPPNLQPNPMAAHTPPMLNINMLAPGTPNNGTPAMFQQQMPGSVASGTSTPLHGNGSNNTVIQQPPVNHQILPGVANVRRKLAKSPDATSMMNGGDVYQPASNIVNAPTQQQQPVPVPLNDDSSLFYQPTTTIAHSYVYTGTPSHLVQSKQNKNNGPLSYFMSPDLKLELINRHVQMAATVDYEQHPELPSNCEHFQNLFPLEPLPKHPMSERPGYFNMVSSCYRATSARDGGVYTLKRIHNYRLISTKSIGVLDIWRKVQHSNVVAVLDVMATKAFRDHCAETLKSRHFSSGATGRHSLNANASYALDETTGTMMSNDPKNMRSKGHRGGPTLLNEVLIWCYVVQLSSAIRTIHSTGLAARTIDPTKILVAGKKLLINCCGINDILHFEQMSQNPVAVIQACQQEDLTSLGRLVLALACNSLAAVQRDHIQQSMELVARHYSPDLKNLIMYLLGPKTHVKSVNDIMPMIGARFFAQLEIAQGRIDYLENELAKEVENGRLFRLVSKLGTIIERPYLFDSSWSETGDRYLLKLFRDYLFHQVTEDGRPWLDMSHVILALNKLDAGVPEKLTLMSPDEHNVLVVSYADLKRCLENSFNELLIQSAFPTHTALELQGMVSGIEQQPINELITPSIIPPPNQ